MTQYSHRLANGLQVVGEQAADALSMAAGYFVKTGSRDEEIEVSGVSHFLEHMAFKGTATRSADDVNREFDEIGAEYNAFTSEEYTVYYAAVLPEYQERALSLLTDMMRPVLREEDFEMEKQVILEEIALYQDQPTSRLIDHARSVYYHQHPLGQSVLGTPESIGSMTADQMRAYHASRYAPDNLVLALAGHFNWEEALEDLEAATRRWGGDPSGRRYPPFEPAPKEDIVHDPSVARAHLCYVCPGVSGDSEERYAASLLADIVGGGEGSRLHWELVHPGLAGSARLSHDEEDRSGAFWGYATCDPDQTQQTHARMLEVLKRVMDEGVTEAELERARRKVASAMVLVDETPRGRLFHLGFQWFYTGVLEPVDTTIDRYLSVTRDDLAKLLERRPWDNLTVVGLGPFTTLT